MSQDIKKLDSICRNLADIEIGLMNGEIEFVYDNLSSAMKAGHPSEIMDGILSTIYYPTSDRSGCFQQPAKKENTLRSE